jgi:hypothetical protein
MVQFCPRCGTQAPDDESVFCNKCGSRLPPVITKKPEIICPQCGMKAPDAQSVFCNRCGTPLQRLPPVQIPRTVVPRVLAAPPVINRKRCPSCGAPFLDEASDFCNKCGATFHRPEPVAPVPPAAPVLPVKPPLPPVKTEPALPVAAVPDDVPGEPVQKREWRRFLKPALIAIAVLAGIVIIAVFLSGAMTHADNQSETTTPAPDSQHTPTPAPTKRTTAPVTTQETTEVPATSVPTTAETANVSAAAVNVTPAIPLNASVNGTANVTPAVTKPLSNIDPSRPFSIGETATDGKGKLTVNGYSLKNQLSDPIPSYAIGKKYLIVSLTYENLQQNVTTEVNLKGMTVEDRGGFSFDRVTDDVMLENPFYLSGKTVPPLENRTGNMAFIVPPEATFLKFGYDFGNQNIAVFQFPQYL